MIAKGSENLPSVIKITEMIEKAELKGNLTSGALVAEIDELASGIQTNIKHLTKHNAGRVAV